MFLAHAQRCVCVVVLSSAEAIDDFESHLGEATEKFERNRGKYERVARTGTVTDMHAGYHAGDEKPAGYCLQRSRCRCVRFVFNSE